LAGSNGSTGVNKSGPTRLIQPTPKSARLINGRLHSLKGDRQGLWAIDINRNWRIVFELKDGNACIVDYEDYH
jgi:plasmid maintenance system killer protein